MRTLKLMLLFTTILSLTFLTSIGTYAEDSPTKIGYVNVAKIFEEYNKTKDSDKVLEEKSKKKESERKTMVAEIRRLKDELELMSEKGRQEKQGAIDEKIKSLQDFDRETRDGLRRERDSLAREILNGIGEAIEEYGQKEGYVMIVNERALLYASRGNNLTDKMIEILNNRYRKELAEKEPKK